MSNWRVIWWDNDGQKRVLRTGLRYHEAVKLWQQIGYTLSFCDYEPVD